VFEGEQQLDILSLKEVLDKVTQSLLICSL
jgi:hypothetical protein